jgi:hypothetical protein
VQNETETRKGEDTDLSEALEGNSSEKTSEFLPPLAAPKENGHGRAASLKNDWIVHRLFKPSPERRVSTLWKHGSCKIDELQWLGMPLSGKLWYDIFNCNWIATRWQLFSTHIHTNNTGNVTKQTVHRTTQKIHRTTQQLRKSTGRALTLGVYPDICLTTEEKARKNLSQGSHT